MQSVCVRPSSTGHPGPLLTCPSFSWLPTEVKLTPPASWQELRLPQTKFDTWGSVIDHRSRYPTAAQLKKTQEQKAKREIKQAEEAQKKEIEKAEKARKQEIEKAEKARKKEIEQAKKARKSQGDPKSGRKPARSLKATPKARKATLGRGQKKTINSKTANSKTANSPQQVGTPMPQQNTIAQLFQAQKPIIRDEPREVKDVTRASKPKMTKLQRVSKITMAPSQSRKRKVSPGAEQPMSKRVQLSILNFLNTKD